ncbi:MAG: 16S rRNA (adenine(1518)-N(6)/adenine(1519)-N(6))-dimethyltransferase RsmA [Fidelibacterota bacterium]|nr:MAG: 16S rRNA (adenine(1518)-N(6)/adenine(1519)-N(6))-dimethyltransferase RsmA [Candidatus Neomarinimicrobiota bacterium]
MAAKDRITRPRGPRPRRTWGQNFLVDPNLIRKIIATIQPGKEEVFLEIGPGHGELTIPLAQEAGAVTAVDIDPLLVASLKERIPDNVTVIQGDILKIDLDTVLPIGCRIYGSLPYNITSPILFRLLEQRSRWRDAHFIVQREVADRMAAAPGGKVYGRLSVMVQAFTAVRKCFDLPPEVFRPRPKVSSALIRLQPAQQHGSIEDEQLFAQVVRLAFGQRRKKLANALHQLSLGDILQSLDLSDLRAENVTVSNYIQIANRLSNAGNQVGHAH